MIMKEKNLKKKSFSLLVKKYIKSHISFIDIGALGFTYEPLEKFSDLYSYYGFDPAFDKNFQKDKLYNKNKKKWAQYTIYPFALDKKNSKKILKIYNADTNNSFLTSNPVIVNRYNMSNKWSVKEKISIKTTSLDSIQRKFKIKNFCDILKIDTQGTELEILKGSKKVLKNCNFLISEISFLNLYKNQCLFSDVEAFLRSQGFSFYAFTDIFYRSKKYFDKTKFFGRERMIFGDAIFIKDIFDKNKKNKFNNSDLLKIFVNSVAFEFYDYALELLNKIKISNQDKKFFINDVLYRAKKTRDIFSIDKIDLLKFDKLSSKYKLYSNLNEYI